MYTKKTQQNFKIEYWQYTMKRSKNLHFLIQKTHMLGSNENIQS